MRQIDRRDEQTSWFGSQSNYWLKNLRNPIYDPDRHVGHDRHDPQDMQDRRVRRTLSESLANPETAFETGWGAVRSYENDECRLAWRQ